jgi:CRP-like cAMP-binding protein
LGKPSTGENGLVVSADVRLVQNGSFPLLRQTELGRFLTDAQLKELERFCRVSIRRPGASFYRQSDPADTVFVLVEGSVELRARPPGRRVHRTVEVVGGSCTFGDEALFADRYFASARTLETSKVLSLQRTGFARLRAESPDIALGILQCAGSCMINTLRRSAVLTQAPANVALRMLLDELTDGQAARNGSPVAVRITHAQLAGVLHLARETVSRMLSQMAETGRIELGRGIIHVRRL